MGCIQLQYKSEKNMYSTYELACNIVIILNIVINTSMIYCGALFQYRQTLIQTLINYSKRTYRVYIYYYITTEQL